MTGLAYLRNVASSTMVADAMPSAKTTMWQPASICARAQRAANSTIKVING